jgi:hypothetical protein
MMAISDQLIRLSLKIKSSEKLKKSFPNTATTALPSVLDLGVPSSEIMNHQRLRQKERMFALKEAHKIATQKEAESKNKEELEIQKKWEEISGKVRQEVRKFATDFKFSTPTPADIAAIIAKDPAQEKLLPEKAKARLSEANKPVKSYRGPKFDSLQRLRTVDGEIAA